MKNTLATPVEIVPTLTREIFTDDRPGPRQAWETDHDYQARLTMWDRSAATEVN